LWGDSHANAIAFVMGGVAKKHNVSFKFYGRGGATPIVGVYPPTFGQPLQRQKDYVEAAFTNILSDPDIKTVILYARWAMPLKGQDLLGRDGPNIWTPAGVSTPEEMKAYYRKCLDNTINQLNAAGKTVVLFYPTPELGVNAPQAVAAAYIHPKTKLSIPDAAVFYRQQSVILQMFDELKPSGQLMRVRTYRPFLSGGKIQYSDGNIPLFSDDHHLDNVGAARLTPIFEQIFAGTLTDDPGLPSEYAE
jgi:hypothetical protein